MTDVPAAPEEVRSLIDVLREDLNFARLRLGGAYDQVEALLDEAATSVDGGDLEKARALVDEAREVLDRRMRATVARFLEVTRGIIVSEGALGVEVGPVLALLDRAEEALADSDVRAAHDRANEALLAFGKLALQPGPAHGALKTAYRYLRLLRRYDRATEDQLRRLEGADGMFQAGRYSDSLRLSLSVTSELEEALLPYVPRVLRDTETRVATAREGGADVAGMEERLGRAREHLDRQEGYMAIAQVLEVEQLLLLEGFP